MKIRHNNVVEIVRKFADRFVQNGPIKFDILKLQKFIKFSLASSFFIGQVLMLTAVCTLTAHT